MNRRTLAILGAGVCVLGFSVAAQTQQAPAPQQMAVAPRPAGVPAALAAAAPGGQTLSADAQNDVVKTYCATCHSEKGKAGGLSLATFDAARATDRVETVEKVIRKLRTGMMPPAGVKRPEAGVLERLAASLETRVDSAAAANPNPGWRPFQRLNRAEYQRAIKDLLGLEMDVAAFLPPDTISHGFDNVADVQNFSPTLMEGYLRAASRIASLAVGDRNASPSSSIYKVPRTTSQMRHVEGAPLGTRGGLAMTHVFPADGEYRFKILLHGIPTGQLFGGTARGEQLEIAINGERVALLDINHRMDESDPNGLNLESPPVHVKAGPHRVSAAFLQRSDAPVDDLLAPIDHTLADTQIGTAFGVTALPHLRDFTIAGPYSVTGVSETPIRRRIFTCRPTTAAEEQGCASDIVKRLATQAYRGPLTADDMAGLLRFYAQGRAEGGDFESGIRMALQAMLVSPRFLFRLEQAPATLRAGETYRLNDLDLASRLSFFLWGTVPDRELVKVAMAGGLKTPAAIEKQVRRMLADPRSEALATRFASQWLRLQDAERIRPDALLYPYWDHSLAEALKRETELFFDSLVREDRSLLDLLRADYTYANDRLARHYGIPNVTGSSFRRVLAAENRRGLGILGHGSMLLLTSVADRTSPVQRGKWIMEVLLGSPPPAPPPNIPSLDDTKAAVSGKLLTVRERMAEHRNNPSCNSCHRVIDPLGLALEPFDVTGRFRIKDNGAPIDAAGELYDGTKMSGPMGLRDALLKHKDAIVLSFTESLMTYAIGRRVEAYDMPTIRAIVRDAAGHDYRLSSFILGVAKSAPFQMARVSGPALTTETAGAAASTTKVSKR